MDEEDAILAWERERAQEEDWEAAYAEDLAMLESGEVNVGPSSKRALYKDSDVHNITPPENGNGEYFPLLSSQDASNTNYSVTIKTHTPSPDSNDNAAGEAESTMQATSQYTKLNQTRTFPHHSNIDRDHPHHITRVLPMKRQPTTSFISSTCESGRRAYISLRDPADVSLKGRNLLLGSGTSLLPMNYAQLQATVEQLCLRDLQRSVASEGTERETTQEESGSFDTKLWVDEFAPRRYTDLLSDEVVNKRLLFWLKQWDQIVFDRDLSANLMASISSMNQSEATTYRADGVAEGPATSKVILLVGPPGVGKTTLAHIVARHAGYATVEVNASDDRSPDKLKQAVLNATQMREVLNVDRRPNCVILDEIDGATTSAVNAVVRIIEGRAKGSQLKRPIICICNDLHAPSLRALRKASLCLAYILHFQPISTSTLVARLDQICNFKGVRIDRQVLSTLCELTEGDIRSCISTIQFLARNKSRVTLRDMQNTPVGRKDKVVHVRSIWTEIFRLSAKRIRQPSLLGALSHVRMNENSHKRHTGHRRMPRIQSLVEANGEYDKIINGLFENYLSIKGTTSFDPDFRKTLQVHDWLLFYQQLQLAMQEEQQFTLLRYCSFAPVSFHLHFASPTRSVIRYPKALYDLDQLQRQNKSTVNQLLLETSPHTRRSQQQREFFMNTLYGLVKIISPQLRITNAAVLSCSQLDRSTVSNVVKIMAHYNLRYVEDLSDYGAGLRLDPSLDTMASFDYARFQPLQPKWSRSNELNINQIESARKTQSLPLVIKQIVARELVVEFVRKQARVSTSQKSKPKINDSFKSEPGSTLPNPKRLKQATNQNQRQVQQKTAAEKSAFLRARIGLKIEQTVKGESNSSTKRDFFGRAVEKTSNCLGVDTKKPKLTRVLFKFNEGSSNAVRRPVRLRDLLS
eukprot:gene3527-6145_t